MLLFLKEISLNGKRRNVLSIGIWIDVLSVIFGGIIGTLLSANLKDEVKTNLNMIFGVCSIAMGINSIILMQNMPAVIFAIVIGTVVGMYLRIGNGILVLGKKMNKITKHFSSGIEYSQDDLVTAIVLFCAGGTGIYGALTAGISGDESILISKAVLDFFTAIIFACNLKYMVVFIGIPQMIVLSIVYMIAIPIAPYISDIMIWDFKACGGIIMLATGFRILKLKMFPIADMIGALIIVMPLSYIWTNMILPIL